MLIPPTVKDDLLFIEATCSQPKGLVDLFTFPEKEKRYTLIEGSPFYDEILRYKPEIVDRYFSKMELHILMVTLIHPPDSSVLEEFVFDEVSVENTEYVELDFFPEKYLRC